MSNRTIEKHVEFRTVEVRRTLEYAVRFPDAGDERSQLVLAIHGWGQSSHSFMRHVGLLADHGFTVVAPQAPHQFYVSTDPKKVGFSWLTMHERDRSVAEFVADMGVMLEDLIHVRPYDEGGIFLFGFSQGVSMAHRLAVSDIVDVKGLVACAADLPPDVEEKLPDRHPYPVLILHSEDDPMVPIEKGESAKAQLERHGFPVEMYRYSGGHVINNDVLDKTASWLESIR